MALNEVAQTFGHLIQEKRNLFFFEMDDLYPDDDFVDDIGYGELAVTQGSYDAAANDFGPVAAIHAPREAKPRILLMGLRRYCE